jgi:fumarate reductase iron-sulfur subunit
MADGTIELIVSRYDPERETEPRTQSYTVPYTSETVVLDALNYVKEELDGSLTYRWSCRMGICGSCGMTVNGTPKLTCATLLRDYAPSGGGPAQPVRIEPLMGFPVIRDLVVDIGDFMEKLQAVKPWLIRREEKPLDAGEYLQTPEERDRYEQYSRCINCMLCYAACPIYAIHPEFVGPAALALAQRYNLDSRDEGAEERREVTAAEPGVWECMFVGECSVVCPKEVDPAGAIQQMKVAGTLDWYRSLLGRRGKR